MEIVIYYQLWRACQCAEISKYGNRAKETVAPVSFLLYNFPYKHTMKKE